MRFIIILFFIPSLLFSQSKKEIIANHEQTIKRLNITIQEKNEIISNKSTEINRVISEKTVLKESLSIEKNETKNLTLHINEANNIIDSISVIIESLSQEVEFFKLQNQGDFASSILDSIYDGDYLITDQTFKIEFSGMYFYIGNGGKTFFPKEKLKITKIDAFDIYADYCLLDLEKSQIRTLTETNINWVKGEPILPYYVEGSNIHNGYATNYNEDINVEEKFYINPPKNVNLNITNIISNSVTSVVSPIEIEFTKSKFASLIIDEDSIIDYMFEIKKDSIKDRFNNSVTFFRFIQNGKSVLDIPLIINEDKCYLALSLSNAKKYFSINFSVAPSRWGRENQWDDIANVKRIEINPSIINSKYFVENWREYQEIQKTYYDEFYSLSTYNPKSQKNTILNLNNDDILLFELIEIE